MIPDEGGDDSVDRHEDNANQERLEDQLCRLDEFERQVAHLACTDVLIVHIAVTTMTRDTAKNRSDRFWSVSEVQHC